MVIHKDIHKWYDSFEYDSVLGVDDDDFLYFGRWWSVMNEKRFSKNLRSTAKSLLAHL
jgi:hypothetical protein